MANLSEYLAHKFLNETLVNATPFVALYTSDPTTKDVGTEVVDPAYKRQPVTFNAPQEIDGKPTVTNTALIEFAVATAGYGEVTHMAIRDKATGGKLLYVKTLLAPITAPLGTGVRIQTGELQVATK